MNILEKRFEEWICDNIDTVVSYNARVVGSQMALPNGGILDVLAVREKPQLPGDTLITEFVVIEVKKEVIDGSAVLQVLNYMGAVSAAVCNGYNKTKDDPDYSQEYEVNGILAAPDITNEAASAIIGAGSKLRFVKLDVAVTAHDWREMKPGGVSESKVESLGDIFAMEFSNSMTIHKEEDAKLKDKPFPKALHFGP